MSIISAGTSVGTSLVSTGDTTGNLVFKTGSSNTTALTISGTDQSITVAGGLNLGTAIGIASGGTGQTTASAAFNALNPMTTTGDMLYESSPTTAARLPIGSTGQILTVAGGVPTWAAAPAGGVTSVATGNGLSGGTITSTGTLTIAAPTFNSIGSYTIAIGNGTNIAYNNTYSASSIRMASTGVASVGCSNVLTAGSGGNVLSGTWRSMSTASAADFTIALMVRVS